MTEETAETAGANAGSKKNRGGECLNLRVGEDMRTAVFARSELEGVSVNAYCKAVLEQALENPERGHALALRSLAELREQVDRVRAAGVLSEGAAKTVLETVEGAASELSRAQPNPGPKREPRVRPWWALPTFLSLGLKDDDE